MSQQHAKPSSPLTPVPKVAAGGSAGAITVIILWIVSTAGLDMPEVVAGAIAWLVTSAAAYLTPQVSRRPATPTRPPKRVDRPGEE